MRPHIQPIRHFRKQITSFHRSDQNVSLVKEAVAVEIQLFENFLPIHHRAIGVVEVDQESGVDDEAVDVGETVTVERAGFFVEDEGDENVDVFEKFVVAENFPGIIFVVAGQHADDFAASLGDAIPESGADAARRGVGEDVDSRIALSFLVNKQARMIRAPIVHDNDFAIDAEVVKSGEDIADGGDDISLFIEGGHNDADELRSNGLFERARGTVHLASPFERANSPADYQGKNACCQKDQDGKDSQSDSGIHSFPVIKACGLPAGKAKKQVRFSRVTRGLGKGRVFLRTFEFGFRGGGKKWVLKDGENS